MIGKAIMAGVAGVYGFKKLEGMESDDIRSIGEKISTAVQDFADGASEKMEKTGFIKNIADCVKSTKIGEKFMEGASKGIGVGVKGISKGAVEFFKTMGDAKQAAQEGKGTFLGNAAKNIAKEAMDIGKSAFAGLTGAVASGASYLAEQGSKAAEQGDLQPAASETAKTLETGMECEM